MTTPVDLPAPEVGAPAAGSVRLVAQRTLYDGGAAVSAVPALSGLVPAGALAVHPADLAELGVDPGGPGPTVVLRAGATRLEVPVVPDPTLARRVVAADFNVPLGTGTVADLIDARRPVVELSMEAP